MKDKCWFFEPAYLNAGDPPPSLPWRTFLKNEALTSRWPVRWYDRSSTAVCISTASVLDALRKLIAGLCLAVSRVARCSHLLLCSYLVCVVCSAFRCRSDANYADCFSPTDKRNKSIDNRIARILNYNQNFRPIWLDMFYLLYVGRSSCKVS